MILCAGENLIDMIQNRETPEGVPEFRGIVGGSPYNCARALGRLSAPAGYITPIATDPMGERLAAALEADHVALLGGRSPRPTSMALVALEDGQPRYQFYREGVADRDVTLDGLRAALPEGAQALHLGSIALMHGPDADALASLVEEARAKGLVISVDPNIRPALPGADDPAYRARLERVFAMADLIKLSDEDLGWWAPGTDLEDAAGALFASAGPGPVADDARGRRRHCAAPKRARGLPRCGDHRSGRYCGRGRHVHGSDAAGPACDRGTGARRVGGTFARTDRAADNTGRAGGCDQLPARGLQPTNTGGTRQHNLTESRFPAWPDGRVGA